MELDGYTAPPSAIRSASETTRSCTLGECFRAFCRRTSARLLSCVVVAAVVARVVVAGWSWRDLVAAATVLAVAPFVEWVTHVFMLHARPRKLGRFTLEMPNAKEHRIHHGAPSDLDWVLMPTYLLPLHLTSVAGIAVAVGALVQLVVGGAWLPLTLSALVTAYAFLTSYEWTHFLMHSPYKPKSRYYRRIWKNHRLHHYKNEHHWFGVTSVVADKALHTAPDQREVEKSPTARALHGEAPLAPVGDLDADS